MRISEKQLFRIMLFFREFSLDTDITETQLEVYKEQANDFWTDIYCSLDEREISLWKDAN